MRKLILIILFFIGCLLLVGVPHLWNSLRYPQPVAMVDGQMDPIDLPAYLELQQLRLLGTEAVRSDSRRGPTFFVPARHQSDAPGAKVRVVLESNDPVLVEALTRSGGKPSAAKEAMVREAFARKTSATGMVYLIDADRETRAKLGGLLPVFAENFAVVREGESPSPGLAAFCLTFAAALSGLLYWIWNLHRPARGPRPPPLPHKGRFTSPADESGSRYPTGRRE